MKKIHLIATFAFLIFIFTTLYLSLDTRKIYNTEDIIGKKIDTVELTLFENNKTFNTKEISNYKFTLFNFWASWCAPCRKEHKNLIRLSKNKNLKIIGVNFLTSRILLASDLNSKIPVLIEPGSINAILVGTGKNEFAELEYLPKKNNVSDGNIVYTSGIDGIIEPAIPIGKVFVNEGQEFVRFFVDFNQIKFVKIGNYNDSSK